MNVPGERVERLALAEEAAERNRASRLTALASAFQWPGGVSDCGPSAQNSAITRAKSPRSTTCGGYGLPGHRVRIRPAVTVVAGERVVPVSAW